MVISIKDYMFICVLMVIEVVDRVISIRGDRI